MQGLGSFCCFWRHNWFSALLFCFIHFVILGIVFPPDAEASSKILRCSAELKKLSREFEQELHRGELQKADRLLTQMRRFKADEFDAHRFDSMRRAYPFFLLFGNDPDVLRKLMEALYQEEYKLLMRINRNYDAKDREEALKALQSFNQIVYSVSGEVEAEAIYFAITSLRDSNPRLEQLVKAKYRIFRSAFVVKGEKGEDEDFPASRLLDDQMNRRETDELYEDLHSLDLVISSRARFFLHKADWGLRALAAANHPISSGYLESKKEGLQALSNGNFHRNTLKAWESELALETQSELFFVADALMEAHDRDPISTPHQFQQALASIEEADPYFLLRPIPDGHPFEGLNLLQMILIQGNTEAVQAALHCLTRNYGWFIVVLEDKLNSNIN